MSKSARNSFHQTIQTPVREGGFELPPDALTRKTSTSDDGISLDVTHGMLVIAAISSCTNTSNPSVMVAAGLLAKKAVERGLKVQPYIKTSLAPGSQVVSEYLQKGGLLETLGALGFVIVRYGCTTCIGNSDPLSDHVIQAIDEADLISAAVLSRIATSRAVLTLTCERVASPPHRSNLIGMGVVVFGIHAG